MKSKPCNYNNRIIGEAKKRFDGYVSGERDTLHPDLRSTVFHLVVKYGNYQDYQQVKGIYEKSSIVDEKLAALSALGASQDCTVLKETLNFALSEKVRNQDLIYAIRSVGYNPSGRLLAWSFFKENYSVFHERFYEFSTALLSRIVSGVTEFSSEAKSTEVEAFFADKKIDAIRMTVDQSLERIRSNTKWLNGNRTAVAKFLKEAVKKMK